MHLRHLFSLVLLFCLACSGSDFTGSSAKKSSDPKEGNDGARDSTDVDEDSDLGGKTDENDTDNDLGDGDITGDLTFEEFAGSDEKIQIDANDQVFERFIVTESKSLVDIAFVIDTSGSMDDEINKVEASLAGFVDDLLTDPLLKNLQLFVLAGKDDQTFDPPAALSQEDHFSYIDQGHAVASRNLLAVARDFLSGDIPSPDLKLRDGATTHFVFVTDDDPETGKNTDPEKSPPGIKSDAFEAAVELDKLVVHGIVCPNGSGDCQAAGQAYSSLATKTGGTIEDIRTSDWGPILKAIGDKVKDITKAEFDLSREAKGSVEVFVNGNKLDGADFDFADNRVTVRVDLDEDDTVIVKYSTE